jgi:hypothetical protein
VQKGGQHQQMHQHQNQQVNMCRQQWQEDCLDGSERQGQVPAEYSNRVGLLTGLVCEGSCRIQYPECSHPQGACYSSVHHAVQAGRDPCVRLAKFCLVLLLLLLLHLITHCDIRKSVS